MNIDNYPWVVFPRHLQAGVKVARGHITGQQYPLTEQDKRNIAMLALAGANLTEIMELIDVDGVGRAVRDCDGDGVNYLKFRLLEEESEVIEDDD